MHARLLEGIEHFNAMRFWEAHESWEEIWLHAVGDRREFLQGLIQLAAAYHHVKRGTLRGGVRLFDSALRRLAKFPEGYEGVATQEAVEAARLDRESAAGSLAAGAGIPFAPHAYPKLALCAPVLHSGSGGSSQG
jgi:predicted metal-dependent hydrolase